MVVYSHGIGFLLTISAGNVDYLSLNLMRAK